MPVPVPVVVKEFSADLDLLLGHEDQAGRLTKHHNLHVVVVYHEDETIVAKWHQELQINLWSLVRGCST